VKTKRTHGVWCCVFAHLVAAETVFLLRRDEMDEVLVRFSLCGLSQNGALNRRQTM
jgi:hypothetical protein